MTTGWSPFSRPNTVVGTLIMLSGVQVYFIFASRQQLHVTGSGDSTRAPAIRSTTDRATTEGERATRSTATKRSLQCRLARF